MGKGEKKTPAEMQAYAESLGLWKGYAPAAMADPNWDFVPFEDIGVYDKKTQTLHGWQVTPSSEDKGASTY